MIGHEKRVEEVLISTLRGRLTRLSPRAENITELALAQLRYIQLLEKRVVLSDDDVPKMREAMKQVREAMQRI